LHDVIKRMTAGEYSYEKILVIAMDIEKSVLEAHYSEIVKTNDVEYQMLMEKVLGETSNAKSDILLLFEDAHMVYSHGSR